MIKAIASVKRITPLTMQAPGTAVATSAPAPTSATAPSKVTSRVENSNEGFCPICNNQLSPTSANGLNVLYCAAHSIVMPARDR